MLLARGADPRITTKTIDIAQAERARSRRDASVQRKVLEAAVPKGQQPTASQVQAAIAGVARAVRVRKDPAAGHEGRRAAANDRNAPGAANNFDPEEINPPVATKGGLTALLHAARQGHLEAARALLDGGAPINQPGAGDATTPLLMAVINGQFDMAMLLIQRGANPNLAADGNGATPLWAADQHAVAAEDALSAAAGNGAAEGDVPRRDEGAARRRRRSERARSKSHPWYLVYSGCGNRNCGLADTVGLDGVLARGVRAPTSTR